MEQLQNTPPKQSTDRLDQSASKAIALKLVIVVGLALVLLLPLTRIQKLVEERQTRKSEVVAEVSEAWAGPMSIAGPALVIPYTIKEVNAQNPSNYQMRYFTVLPETLNVEGEINHQPRKRSLFEVILFQADLGLTGSYAIPEIDELLPSNTVAIHWDECFITFSLSDQSGINASPSFTLEDTNLSFEPAANRLVGSKMTLPMPSGASIETEGYFNKNRNLAAGFEAHIPLELTSGQQLSFEMDLPIKGSGELGFVPTGKETTVSLTSDWSSPSFAGAYLPNQPETGADGFKATWNVSYLNRGFPQSANDFAQEYSLEHSLFGVRLIEPVDSYVQTSRSVKYGILIITLTFLGFFLMEVISKRKIHPLQYILVGVALVVFYTLLVSLSEHTTFGWSYLIAASATIALITFYISAVLKSARLTFTQAFGLTIVYTFIFVILRLEDYSLLAGSVGLFFVVGLLMALTRKVNWYEHLPNQNEVKNSLT